MKRLLPKVATDSPAPEERGKIEAFPQHALALHGATVPGASPT